MRDLILIGIGIIFGASVMILWVNAVDNREWLREFKKKHGIK